MNENEINSALNHKYGYEIYNFAISLAVLLSSSPQLGFFHIYELKNEQIKGINEVKAEIKRLGYVKNRLKKIADDLSEHLEQVPDWHIIHKNGNTSYYEAFQLNSFKEQSNKDEITKEIYSLEKAMEIIEEEHDYLKNNIWEPFKRKPGNPATPSVIIFALWSFIIRRNNKIIWDDLRELVGWFYKKLKKTEYRKVISESNYPLQIPFYRFKKKHQRKFESDLEHFFGSSSDKRDLCSRIQERAFQIHFKTTGPEILAFARPCKINRSPLIIFPDKSTFP